MNLICAVLEGCVFAMVRVPKLAVIEPLNLIEFSIQQICEICLLRRSVQAYEKISRF
jgi:hypothetical protein